MIKFVKHEKIMLAQLAFTMAKTSSPKFVDYKEGNFTVANGINADEALRIEWDFLHAGRTILPFNFEEYKKNLYDLYDRFNRRKKLDKSSL